MSIITTNLINQLNQSTATTQETTLRLVQWFDYQARWNQENNRDFRDLDIAREKIEDEITEVKKDLKRKREDIEEGKEKQDKVDDIIAKLVAAVAVLEGQVEQQRILLDHTQTLATRAIKRARLSTRQGESPRHTNNRAGPSSITHTGTPAPPIDTIASVTLGHPLVRTRAHRSSSIITIRSRSPSIEIVSRPATPIPESQPANRSTRSRTPYSPPIFTELFD